MEKPTFNKSNKPKKPELNLDSELISFTKWLGDYLRITEDDFVRFLESRPMSHRLPILKRIASPKYLSKIYSSNPIYLNDTLKLLLPHLQPADIKPLATVDFLMIYSSNPIYLNDTLKLLLPYLQSADIKPLATEEVLNIYAFTSRYLPYFTNLNLHRYIESPEQLSSYGRRLIEYCYSSPKISSRLSHTIYEIQAQLDNMNTETSSDSLASSPHPFISQQNIIQMGSLTTANEYEKSYNTDAMVARSLGFLKEGDITIDQQETISPHPAFAPAKLKLEGSTDSIFVIKDWENVEPVTINKRNENKEIINSISVKPLGVDTNFYYAYYLTGNNLIMKICLNMSLTKDLMKAGEDIFAGLDSYFDQKLAQEFSRLTNADKSRKDLSHITAPIDMYNWLKQRYPDFNQNGSGDVETWKDLKAILNQEKTTTFAEFPTTYETILWQCNQSQQAQVADRFDIKNEDMIRLIASTDHSPFYKVCATILKGKVLAGNDLSNSHSNVYYDKMAAIQANIPPVQMSKPSLVLVSNDENAPNGNYSLELTREIHEPKDFVITGSQIPSLNPELAQRISLHFLLKNQISVGGILLTKEEFADYKLLPGDNIEFV
jgi:hypothetical protein